MGRLTKCLWSWGGNHDEWRIFVADQYDFKDTPLVTPTDYQDATVALWGPTLGKLFTASDIR